MFLNVLPLMRDDSMGTAELARFDSLNEANAYIQGYCEFNEEIIGRLVIYKEEDGTYTVNMD